MLESLIAAVSGATLALLVAGIRVLTKLYRRLQDLEDREQQRIKAKRIINGEDPVPPQAGPVRRRQHLALHRGGAAAALIAIGLTVRAIWRANCPVGYTMAAAGIAAGGFASAVYVTPDIDSRPEPGPSVALAAPRTPGPEQSTPPGPAKSPPPTGKTRSASAGSPSPNRAGSPSASPSNTATTPGPTTLPTRSLLEPPLPSASPPPRDSDNSCPGVGIPPILNVNLCVLGGHDGGRQSR